jgi:putative tryptophan/tyrosine transport system substrate-binding protein
MLGIRRREFITLLSGAATWPLAARAQQPIRIARIGWMDFVPESDPATPARVIAFRKGMEKQGWVLGRNLAIDYRWSIFDMERARATAEELLNLAPDGGRAESNPVPATTIAEPNSCAQLDQYCRW